MLQRHGVDFKHYLNCLLNNVSLFLMFTLSGVFSPRAKYHKLKYGTELNQGDMKPPSYDSGKTRHHSEKGVLRSSMVLMNYK